MTDVSLSRRELLAGSVAAAVWPLFARGDDVDSNDVAADASHIACNEYPWKTFDRRDGTDFRKDLAASIARVASTGVNGFEPLADSVEFLRSLVPLLKRHGLRMRSIYVNSVLHDPERLRESIAEVLRFAGEAQKLADTSIVVTNPSPIRWGGDEDKTDDQLRHQGEALSMLGAKLRTRGMTLAYHNHDAELRRGGREFHHMLAGTDAESVRFCLDAHWIFRGCGDSEVAVFDALRLYGDRIVELHLRQSTGGVWDEAFAPVGDIAYDRLWKQLVNSDNRPHLVLEQAVEAKSSRKMTAVDSHRRSRKELQAMVE